MVIPYVSVLHNHNRGPGSGSLAGRLGFIGAITALPVAMALALATFDKRPTVALAVILAPVAFVLARRSIAYPVALGGIPTLVIALLGRDPFPHGLITALFFVWTVLAIVLTLQGNEHRLPMGLLIATPVLASLLLTVELLVRLSASQDSSYGTTKLKLFILENVTRADRGSADRTDTPPLRPFPVRDPGDRRRERARSLVAPEPRPGGGGVRQPLHPFAAAEPDSARPSGRRRIDHRHLPRAGRQQLVADARLRL